MAKVGQNVKKYFMICKMKPMKIENWNQWKMKFSGLKRKICARMWRLKMAHRFCIFGGFHSSFKWVKRESSGWKSPYICYVSDNNSVWNKS